VVTRDALAYAFFETATRRGDAVFLREGATAATWREAARRVRELAGPLRRSPDPIVLPVRNTIEWMLALLAANAAGTIAILAPGEMTPTQIGALGAIAGPHRLLDSASGTVEPRLEGQQPLDWPQRAAICLPTSGSTGAPRLAIRSADSFLAESDRYVANLDLRAEDTILVALPLGHAFVLGLALAAIGSGCALDLMPQLIPQIVLRRIDEARPAILPLVPAAARLLCLAAVNRPIAFHPRCVVVGAGTVSAALEEQIRAAFGTTPHRNYGSTESGATLGTRGESVADGITGRPLDGVEIAVLPGPTRGTLFVRTATPFEGYASAGGIEISRISPDGWYHTGDNADIRDGAYVRIAGRSGVKLRRGGRTIEPAEVETALRAIAGVMDACVIGVPDDTAEDVIEAHLEPEAAPGDEERIRNELATRLETYKHPARFIFHNALPRGAGGKPDRARLRAHTTHDAADAAEVLTRYRIANAAAAAESLGIFEELAGAPATATELARRRGLHPPAVEALGRILSRARLLGEDNARYRLQTPARGLRELAALENALAERYTAARIAIAAHGATAHAANGASMPAAYSAAMAAAGKRAALHSMRHVGRGISSVLDIGCPAGGLADAFAARGAIGTVRIALDPSARGWSAPSADRFDVVFVHNAIRRIASGGDALRSLVACVSVAGTLVIADIFADAEDPVAERFLVDWLVDGILVYPTFGSLRDELIQLGFDTIDRIPSPPLFELLVARRGSREES
jgi:long-chain acyl-CoA synthetase